MVKTIVIDKFNPAFKGLYASTSGRMSYSLAAFEMFLNNIIIGSGHYSTHYLLDFSIMKGSATTTSSLFAYPAELGLFGVFCVFLYIRFFYVFKLFSIPIVCLWLNGEFMPYNILMLFILIHQGEMFFINLLHRKIAINTV